MISVGTFSDNLFVPVCAHLLYVCGKIQARKLRARARETDKNDIAPLTPKCEMCKRRTRAFYLPGD